MPRFDRTGPEGKGPKTGRGLGNCNPDEKTKESAGWLGGLFLQRRRRQRRFWNFNTTNDKSDNTETK